MHQHPEVEGVEMEEKILMTIVAMITDISMKKEEEVKEEEVHRHPEVEGVEMEEKILMTTVAMITDISMKM